MTIDGAEIMVRIYRRSCESISCIQHRAKKGETWKQVIMISDCTWTDEDVAAQGAGSKEELSDREIQVPSDLAQQPHISQ